MGESQTSEGGKELPIGWRNHASPGKVRPACPESEEVNDRALALLGALCETLGKSLVRSGSGFCHLHKEGAGTRCRLLVVMVLVPSSSDVDWCSAPTGAQSRAGSERRPVGLACLGGKAVTGLASRLSDPSQRQAGGSVHALAVCGYPRNQAPRKLCCPSDSEGV